jgi:hypothetical protein
MTRIATPSRLYWLAGLLCLPAPLVPSGVGVGADRVESLRMFPFVFYALPLTAASFALGFSHWKRRTRGTFETFVAVTWLVAAVGMSLPVAAWAPSVTGLATAQAIAIGLSALALLVSSTRTLCGADAADQQPTFRVLQAGGSLLIALLFARGIFGAYVWLSMTHSSGLERLVAEAKLFAGVLAVGATAIAAGAAGDWWRGRAAHKAGASSNEMQLTSHG